MAEVVVLASTKILATMLADDDLFLRTDDPVDVLQMPADVFRISECL